jgi:hypothetical protein
MQSAAAVKIVAIAATREDFIPPPHLRAAAPRCHLDANACTRARLRRVTLYRFYERDAMREQHAGIF